MRKVLWELLAFACNSGSYGTQETLLGCLKQSVCDSFSDVTCLPFGSLNSSTAFTFLVQLDSLRCELIEHFSFSAKHCRLCLWPTVTLTKWRHYYYIVNGGFCFCFSFLSFFFVVCLFALVLKFCINSLLTKINNKSSMMAIKYTAVFAEVWSCEWKKKCQNFRGKCLASDPFCRLVEVRIF